MHSHNSTSTSAQLLQVRQFYQEHYSANLCKLVVLGRESLDELQQRVLELFSAVENRLLPVPSFSGELLERTPTWFCCLMARCSCRWCGHTSILALCSC